MKTKFLTFFSLVTLVGILSVIDSWIIQQQLHGGINFVRAIFQIALIALILYMLWGRSTPGYALAMLYVIANAVLYSYELFQSFVLKNPDAHLPLSAVVVSGFLITSTVLVLGLLTLDYIDYRKRRISNNH